MDLLFYAPVTHGSAERLQTVIEALVTSEGIEICRTIDSLARRLCQLPCDWVVSVLMAATRRDLLELISIQHLLSKLHIILVLPDRDHDTIAKGHKLGPRFLDYTDGNFAELGAVLSKMLQSTHDKRMEITREDVMCESPKFFGIDSCDKRHGGRSKLSTTD